MLGVNVYEIDPVRISPEAPHLGRARALGTEPECLGVRERLEPRHERRTT